MARQKHTFNTMISELRQLCACLTFDPLCCYQLQEELNALYCQEEIVEMREDENEEA